MKNPLLKKAVPHLIAVLIFLVVSILFCKPVLEGNVLNQDDITKWKGVAQNSFEYKEKNGHYPLWNPNVFSGMPNYQIAMQGKSILPDMVKIFTFGLPKPINFFFLACICFYILCIALSVRPVVGIMGALAFAFSTYNPVIINAGHDTQMLATALMPLLLAGIIFTFEKKYWLGLALTTIGAYQELGANHYQISFYFMLIAVAVTLAYLFIWIKKKDWKHIALSAGITIIAAITGLAGSALTLMTTSEYTKYTMRGGKDISISGDKVSAAKTSGLDTAYAFEYSVSKPETSTFLMPNAFGGDSRKGLSINSHVTGKLTTLGLNQTNAEQVAQSLPRYWGGLPFTSGPAYFGAIICVLGLIGFVIIKTPLRWGLLAVTILGIFMSWGKYFPGFNAFLFEHLPLYNKFRSPSMAQVIPQLTMALIAVLALQQLLFAEKSKELLKADFKKILYTIGGLFALLTILYISMDYRSPIDNEIANSISQQAKNDQIGRAVITGMKADRMAMFGGQLLRALAFALFTLGILYMYLKNIIKKPIIVAIAIIIVSTLELTIISKDYLSDENYVSPDELANNSVLPVANNQQLVVNDKDPDFRVLNMTTNPLTDARTSYFFKSLTGYHPARLRIYQDIMDKYLSGKPNPVIVNMLNTKYVIIQDPSSGQPTVVPNPEAFGSCWLVKNVKLVDDQVAEIQAIGNTNLKDTAIVDKSFSKYIVQPQWDSASSVRLTKFDNDAIEYEANRVLAPQFAVFSEIYYPKGWNAYMDGKKVDYCKTDYLLRGLSLPLGKHTVRFAFEPVSVKKGVSIMYIASFLILIFFLGGLFMAWRESRKSV